MPIISNLETVQGAVQRADIAILASEVFGLMGRGLGLLVPYGAKWRDRIYLVSREGGAPYADPGAVFMAEALGPLPFAVLERLQSLRLIRKMTENRVTLEPGSYILGWREAGFPGDQGDIWRCAQ